MSQSPYSAVDDSADPASLVAFLDRAADGLGGMKRYVAYRMSQLVRGPVLDLGCGAGHDLSLLDDVGLWGVGLDASAIMLAEARSRNLQRLIRGTGKALPFRDESFDGCRIERVLMHVAPHGRHQRRRSRAATRRCDRHIRAGLVGSLV